MSHLLPSVSVVAIVRDTCPPLSLMSQMIDRLERLFTDFEFILVANDVDAQVALELKSLVEQLPDSLAVFLGEQVHDDLARLVGIDHAVSDYVLFCTPTLTEIDYVERFEQPLRAGNEVVVGQDPAKVRRSFLGRALFNVFRTAFRWTTRKTFEERPAEFRILTRAAALYVATRSDGEVLVRARFLGSGFPVADVAVPEGTNRRRNTGGLLRDLARGARLIATGSTALLRVSSYLAVAGGALSAIYMAYVVVVYAFRADVQPGWTTLSLQLSGMMLLFSVQFLLLAEHVMQIVTNNPTGNRRHLVIRELRSPSSRRSARLNVVDHQGRFQLGAPERMVEA